MSNPMCVDSLDQGSLDQRALSSVIQRASSVFKRVSVLDQQYPFTSAVIQSAQPVFMRVRLWISKRSFQTTLQKYSQVLVNQHDSKNRFIVYISPLLPKGVVGGVSFGEPPLHNYSLRGRVVSRGRLV